MARKKKAASSSPAASQPHAGHPPRPGGNIDQPAAPETAPKSMGAPPHADFTALAEMFDVPRRFLEAQEQLEAKLSFRDVAERPAAFALEGDAIGLENILGTSIGFRERNGFLTDEVALTVHVREKVHDKGRIAQGLIDKEEAGVPTDVVESLPGIPYARPVGPSLCGTSVRPAASRYLGTIGALGMRGNRCVLLSNNHVLAMENAAETGLQSPIVAPSSGHMPEYWIGYLEAYQPLHPGQFNRVDAAVAWVPTDGARVTPRHRSFTIDPRVVAPRLDMTVKKEGVTTNLTYGKIVGVNYHIRDVQYARLGSVAFENVVIIRSQGSTMFSWRGDSGSLIVESSTNRPVALLFGGDGRSTFGNPISEVMSILGIQELIDRF